MNVTFAGFTATRMMADFGRHGLACQCLGDLSHSGRRMIDDTVALPAAWDVDRQFSGLPSVGEGSPSPGKDEAAGFRTFCKSLARVQEILCWAAVENVLTKIESAPKVPPSTDVRALSGKVREFAGNLMQCAESHEAISKGYLDCEKVAAFVQLLGLLPQDIVTKSLRGAHLMTEKSRPAPFYSFGSFVLSICDLAENSDELRGSGV
jgi:hypothetical protein